MVTSDLGACEWFVWDLRRSGLIDRGQLDQIVSEFLKRNPRAEAPALAEYLVDQETITSFQAERILNGKTQGLVLGPYVLLDAIGSGSMGQVYKANSKNDNALYAVKVLPRRSMWNVRLARRQVRSFGQFTHPAVVPFVDVGTAGGLHYLVWPLVDGVTLEGLVQQQGRLSPQQSAVYAIQTAQGLTIAHQNNLFHGLVKPSNIMVGADNQARILDFGIGSLLVENEGESLVDTMSTANTLTSGLDCASPESIMEPTNRTPAGDQYSLGCVMYYCLTGRVPYPEGSAVEKMMAHQTRDPMPIQDLAPEVPKGLVAIVSKLMAKNPDDRYTGCDELVEALEPFVGDMSHMPGGAPVVAATTRSTSRSQAVTLQRPAPAAATLSRQSGATSPPTRKSVEPARPAPQQPARAATPGARAPAPAPSRMSPSLPSRASFQLPPLDDEFETNSGSGPITPVDTPILEEEVEDRVPAGWVDETRESRRRSKGSGGGGGGGNYGTLGLVAAAILLMVAAYFGATLMMK